jgi:hypothetical protein
MKLAAIHPVLIPEDHFHISQVLPCKGCSPELETDTLMRNEEIGGKDK